MSHQTIEQAIHNSLFDFSIDKQEEKVFVTGLFQFKEDFPAFAGHFPEEPIFPAVIQLALVRHLVDKAYGVKSIPDIVERTKFSGFIRPDGKVEVRIECDSEQDKVRVDFRIKRQEDNVAAGTVRFKLSAEN